MRLPDPAQYESFAGEYEAHAEVAPYNALYDRPATLALLGPVDGLRVFDAACGPGIYAGHLLAAGATVTGCDASASMIDLATQRTGGRADLRVHSLEDPLTWVDDESVDVALSALALHYVSDRAGFLREVHRILVPGGALVISTHHPTDDWARLGGSYFETSTVTEIWKKGWEVTTWRMPLGRLTADFTEAGFLIEQLVEPLPLPEMAESHPKAFAKLSVQPAFLLARLRKPPVHPRS